MSYEHPVSDPATAAELEPVGSGGSIESSLRLLRNQLNLLIQMYNSVLGLVEGIQADYLTSLYTGSTNIVTVGTIGEGAWNATAIADGKIASAGKWDGKEDVLTFANSLDRTDDTVELEGDADTPGNWKVYATSSVGAKGWYSGIVIAAAGAANQYPGVNDAGDDLEWKSLEGTADVLTVTHAAGTMTLDIADGYVGQASITTLGTVATGIWNADVIAKEKLATDIISLGTVATGVWNADVIAKEKLATDIISLGTVATGIWNADVIAKEKLATNIVSLGTVGTGVWEGTVIDKTYLATDIVSLGTIIGGFTTETNGNGTGTDANEQLRIQGDAGSPMYLKLGVNDAGTYSYIQSTRQGVAHDDLKLQPLGGDVIIGSTTISAAGLALIDDASAADQCTTLGLGTGNSPTFAGLTVGGATFSAAGKALIDDASAADQRTTLGLGIGDSPTFTKVTIGSIQF